ncbi:hypothetical protein D3C76_1332610 [compost metagenome]
MADGHKGSPVGDDDPAFLQADKGQKQPDPDRDRMLQVMGNRFAEYPVQRGERNDCKQHAGYHHYRKRFTPVQLHGMYQGIGKEGVYPHARHHNNRRFAAKGH